METKLKVPAGTLFVFSQGEYSDYDYTGHFLALEDITEETLKRAKAKARERALSEPRYGEMINPDDTREVNYATKDFFIPEFVRLGVALSIDCAEIHLSGYGELPF